MTAVMTQSLDICAVVVNVYAEKVVSCMSFCYIYKMFKTTRSVKCAAIVACVMNMYTSKITQPLVVLCSTGYKSPSAIICLNISVVMHKKYVMGKPHTTLYYINLFQCTIRLQYCLQLFNILGSIYNTPYTAYWNKKQIDMAKLAMHHTVQN